MKRLQVIVLVIGFVVIGRGDSWTPDSAFAQNLTPLAPTGREDEPGRSLPPAQRLGILVEEINATRSSIEGASRLEIRLGVLCPGIEKALGLRCRVFRAVDDTGEDLRDGEGSVPGYSMLAPTVRLKLPSRKATVLKELSGLVELVFPDRDPQATINIANFVGKPRVEASHPVLTTNGVRLTILSKGEFDRIRARGHEASQQQAVDQNFGKATETKTSPLGDAPGLGNNAIVVLQDDPNHRVAEYILPESPGRSCPKQLHRSWRIIRPWHTPSVLCVQLRASPTRNGDHADNRGNAKDSGADTVFPQGYSLTVTLPY